MNLVQAGSQLSSFSAGMEAKQNEKYDSVIYNAKTATAGTKIYKTVTFKSLQSTEKVTNGCSQLGLVRFTIPSVMAGVVLIVAIPLPTWSSVSTWCWEWSQEENAVSAFAVSDL